MSQPSSQVSFPVSNFFPKDQYQNDCKANLKIVPMYLIALGQSNDKIKTQLDKRDPNYVATEKYGLTALTVAVWKRNHEIIGYLLNTKKVKPLPRDCANFTPLLYAALLEDTTSMTLIQQAAKKVWDVVLDRSMLFPEWEKILNPSFPKADETVFYYQNDSGKIVAGNAKQFVERTGAESYYDGVLSTKQVFINVLSSQLEKPIFGEYNLFLQDLAKQSCEKKIQGHLFYLAKQGSAGDGVHALAPLKKGSICGTYGGELQHKKNTTETHYQFENVQAQKIRNLAGMINDGFPNCSFFKTPFENGIEEKFLVPLRDIKKNEPLFWDYGFEHHIKLEQRVEFNETEMESYFRKNSPTKLYKELCLHAIKNTPQDLFEAQINMIRLFYIFNTPSAMLHLWIKEIVNIDDIKSLLNEDKFLQFLYLSSSSLQQRAIISNIINIAESLLTNLSRLKSHKISLQNALLTLLQKSSFHSFIIVLEHVLANFPTSFEKWKEKEKIYMLGTVAVDTMYRIIVYDPNSDSEKCFSLCKEKLEPLPSNLQKAIISHLTDFAKSRAPQTLTWLKKYEDILDK